MRWRSAWLTACSCGLLAGCGGMTTSRPPPKLPAAVANQLASEARSVATLLQNGETCAAHAQALQLQQAVINAAGNVPTAYQEPMMSTANELVTRIQCTRQTDEGVMHGSDKHKHHEKKKHHGKHDGGGD